MNHPQLTERWKPADWSPSEWVATIPSFTNPDNNIRITLEVIPGGQCEWTITGQGGQIGQEMAGSKEEAANDALHALKKHFQDRRKVAPYVLQYLPWNTDRQLKQALDTGQSTANNWRNGKSAMCRRSVTMAARHMGVHGYSRGGGEICKLETAYWETPEYAMSPYVDNDYRTGKAGRKPGAAWWGKNAKKKVDTPPES